MWLTLGTFVGYAVVYTVLLKPATPQNIVIGGASGAMPPVLGWAAVDRRRAAGGAAAVPDHLRLDAAAFLVARALPRARTTRRRAADAAGDARRASTRGCMIVLYTVALVAVTLLPFAIRMSGVLYLAAALVLGARVPALRGARSTVATAITLARATFRYSIVYLAALFSALLRRPLLALI